VSDRTWVSTNSGRGAIALLATSALLALWTLVQAIRIEPVPELPAPRFSAGGALATPEPSPAIDVAAAVETDPFTADRSAPERRYSAPGEESDEAAPKEAAAEPVVLGTALSDAVHSFATVQLADGFATIMHTGDKIGEYTVQSIERGHVVFTTRSGKRLDIPELKP
jgi:hypothetical protein